MGWGRGREGGRERDREGEGGRGWGREGGGKERRREIEIRLETYRSDLKLRENRPEYSADTDT